MPTPDQDRSRSRLLIRWLNPQFWSLRLLVLSALVLAIAGALYILSHLLVPAFSPGLLILGGISSVLALLCITLYVLSRKLERLFQNFAQIALQQESISGPLSLDHIQQLIRQLQDSRSERASAEQQAGQQARDSLRVAAHEIRRPLQRLSFAIQALEDDPQMPADAPARRAIHSAMEEISTLVDETLWYARISHGPLPLHLSRFSIHSLVDQQIAELREIHPQLECRTMPGAPTPPVFQADRKLLERALANLLANAAKYGNGQVMVSWQWSEFELILTVHDNGPGIPRMARDKVFEPFITASESQGVQVHGGLGLAIVKGIVLSHGGSIQATESPLGGAALVLCIPLHGRLRSLA